MHVYDDLTMVCSSDTSDSNDRDIGNLLITNTLDINSERGSKLNEDDVFIWNKQACNMLLLHCLFVYACIFPTNVKLPLDSQVFFCKGTRDGEERVIHGGKIFSMVDGGNNPRNFLIARGIIEAKKSADERIKTSQIILSSSLH